MEKKVSKKSTNSLPSKDYLTWDPIKIYNPQTKTLGGEVMTEEKKHALREEALFLETTQLWDVFQHIARKDACETMFYHSKSFDDMKTGKAMLNALQSLKVLVTEFKNLK